MMGTTFIEHVYKYRWYYVAVLMTSSIVSAYVMIIQPGWGEYRQLHEKLAAYHQALLQKQQAKVMPVMSPRVTQASLTISPERVLLDVSMLAADAGLALQTVTILGEETLNTVTATSLRLDASVTWQAMDRFLSSLTSLSYLVTIMDMQYRIERNHANVLTMRLLIWPLMEKLMLPQNALTSSQKPLCWEAQRWVIDEVAFSATVPLSRMRMVGYWGTQQHPTVLIRMPGNIYRRIQLGDLLGKEHSPVIAMTPEKVVLCNTVPPFRGICGTKYVIARSV